jgi:hypothetical protein
MRDKEKYKEYKNQLYLNDIGRRSIPPKIKRVGDGKNFYSERKFQEEVTRLWNLYGIFIMPDKKDIQKQIEKEELLYEDTIEDVDIEDCEIKNDDEEYESN